jgi:hypothetical protein
VSDAIFVVGYYRSGTSALSGTLQRLGVVLHNDADANEHNPLGFYEIPELIEFDVELFNRLRVAWQDVRNLEPGWWERADMAPFLSRLGEILRRRFGNEALWAIKHPHMCRLFPIYERAARQADQQIRVIHMCRDPWTVATSQQKKNGLSRAHALLLWASYLVSAEGYARGQTRTWLTYRDLLGRPAAEIKRIEQDLGIDLCHRLPNGLREATAFLTTQLDRSTPAPTKDLLGPLQTLVGTMWQVIQDRDFSPDTWDGLGASTKELTNFVEELGTSKGPVLPWLATIIKPAGPSEAEKADGRPPERLDSGARNRLQALLRDTAAPLPSLAVVIAAPPNRAHAINDTLQALTAQWHAADSIRIIATDPVEIPEHRVIRVSEESGALTRALCEEVALAATEADYVAILNAGDAVAKDACLRFALEAAGSRADLIYCDEVVPRDGGDWVRHKPAWDVTRLRQAPFLGDWVWYRAETLRQLGGFDPALAGAEEYDYQLRLAEAGARIRRLPETLFTRNTLSRRDNIPSTVFIQRAADAIAAHLRRSGLPATVEPRQHLGLYRHVRETEDPGTAIILLCDGAEIPQLDSWLKDLLGTSVLSGPIILAGAELSPQMTSYLTQVIEKAALLQDKVLAVRPAPGLQTGDALRGAIALASTEHIAIIDVRAKTASPDWRAALRHRLADPRVALVGARSLVAATQDKARFVVQGPIVIGAQARMGTGHFLDDPGPGGWLVVDQEVSAVSPPGLIGRRRALAACAIPSLSGDALWIDICAQLRAAGGAVVWTPDVSFLMGAGSLRLDAECLFRTGSEIARSIPWEDPFHHPALSLRGDLLQVEQRLGLVRAAPPDPRSLLLTGMAELAMGAINGARALRAMGLVEASWSPETISAAEVGRRAPTSWIRLNPETPALPHMDTYTAIISKAPKPEAKAVLAAATQVFATSPELVTQVRRLLPPSRGVTLWRPALSRPVWAELGIGSGINSRPRILWIDEGIEPSWLPSLINETITDAVWIIVERPGGSYQGAVTRVRPAPTEQSWAAELAGVAPHLLVRPADRHVEADHYKALMAAAVGCHLLVDDRLDIPPSLEAIRLPNRIAAWQRAIKQALADLPVTLQRGKQTRAACLALPSIEEAPPGWATPGCATPGWADSAPAVAADQRAAE